MSSAAARLAVRQHAPLALLVVFLLASSPWVSLRRSFPPDAGPLDWAHLVLGLLALALGLAYAWACLRGGAWRAYLPWLSGRFGPVLRDVRELFRGRRPASESGGLHSAIEGLLLLALLAAGATGAGWYAMEGTGAALDWRAAHVIAARAVLGLLVAHAIAVSLHLLDFVRN